MALQQEYVVRPAGNPPDLGDGWDSPSWRAAETASIGHFHPKSSMARPVARARLLYDAAFLYGIFQIRERYVLCRQTRYQDPVYRDACAEFFVKPCSSRGYFNLEMNACGVLLLRYVEDPVRLPDGRLRKSTPVPWELGQQVRVQGSLAGPIFEEIADETAWSVSFAVPYALFEPFSGPIAHPSTHPWRGNFFKCAEDCSHPHWASWTPIGESLNFHRPDLFGTLRFA